MLSYVHTSWWANADLEKLAATYTALCANFVECRASIPLTLSNGRSILEYYYFAFKVLNEQAYPYSAINVRFVIFN